MWWPSPAAAQRTEKRRANFFLNLNPWPFLGVMITLLITFMVQTKPFHYSRWPRGGPRALSETPQPLAMWEDAKRISVTHDGRIFCLDTLTSVEDLPGLLLQSVKEGAQRKVFLGVDARSRCGDTAIVLDQMRVAGIENACFITR